jgi:hypothetical protein
MTSVCFRLILAVDADCRIHASHTAWLITCQAAHAAGTLAVNPRIDRLTVGNAYVADRCGSNKQT